MVLEIKKKNNEDFHVNLFHLVYIFYSTNETSLTKLEIV